MPDWYFDDIPLNEPMTTPEYPVSEEEIIAFARKWDPLPMHTDAEAARASGHGGLIAPATYTVAVLNALGHQFSARTMIVAGSEWKARFLQPVRPGDRLVATSACISKRPSRSKADRGIAQFVNTLRNQRGEIVLELECTVVVSRREEADSV